MKQNDKLMKPRFSVNYNLFVLTRNVKEIFENFENPPISNLGGRLQTAHCGLFLSKKSKNKRLMDIIKHENKELQHRTLFQ